MHTVIFFNVATADTSHNSLNTWECVPLNTYHVSDLLHTAYGNVLIISCVFQIIGTHPLNL